MSARLLARPDEHLHRNEVWHERPGGLRSEAHAQKARAPRPSQNGASRRRKRHSQNNVGYYEMLCCGQHSRSSSTSIIGKRLTPPEAGDAI